MTIAQRLNLPTKTSLLELRNALTPTISQPTSQPRRLPSARIYIDMHHLAYVIRSETKRGRH